MDRKPAVAGMFYPADPTELDDMTGEMLSKADARSDCFGVISPHAGYIYSGQTPAWAIASLQDAKTFVILGPNHSGIGSQFAVMSEGSWQTPFGRVPVSTAVAGKILDACNFAGDDAAAHAMEHSVEVQLPLLQARFKGNLRIVPVSVMCTDYTDDFLGKCQALGKAIAELSKKQSIAVIASSDFSHYLPRWVAEEKESKALERIFSLDGAGFFKTLEQTDASVCGYGPIAVLMSAADALGLKARHIHKSDSGEKTKDYESVVAYHAVGFY